jgi:hypothetical protein
MAMRSGTAPTVACMRPITLICALAATLQLSCSSASAAGGWTWPIRGPVLTPYRNGGDPYAAGQHRGIDIGAPAGSRVVAAVGGTVTFAGVVGSSGLTVSERSADGRFDLSYLHLSSIAVHRGDVLPPGGTVGAVGVSGRRSVAAPHLHFGVRQAGTRNEYRDPLDFLAPPPGDGAPRPGPAPAPVAHPAAPAHAPVGRRGPKPAGPPRPERASRPGRVWLPSPVRVPAPAARAARAHHAPHSPGRVPAPLAGPAPVASPHATVPPAAKPAPHPTRGGLNLGWLFACIGLIAAATALGQPATTRKLATRGRTRLSAILRPASRRL